MPSPASAKPAPQSAIGSHPATLRLLQLVAGDDHAGLAPTPKLTVSGWADTRRVLSREASSEPGAWRTDRAPYQAGIMDALADPMIERVVFKKAAQVGATEILNNIVGFYIDQDPAPILVIQPNVDPMAKAWSMDRLAPMLRDTPCLVDKVREPRSRESGNTILHKVFHGGHLTVVGANSPAGLAARPIRILLCDEIDRFPLSSGSEGDPVELGHQRTRTFWNRKEYFCSTPTLKGFSRIELLYSETDQRRFYVPCLHCGAYQTLTWRNVVWEQDDPDSARYRCEPCGKLMEEAQKTELLQGGEWRAEQPGSRIAGFHINALYSPWARWADLVRDWLAAQQDTTRLQVFTNTVLGEEWEEGRGALHWEGMMGRRESYAAQVPTGVGLLTCGLDVQDDRLEATVVGWGAGEETWLIHHAVLLGDPERPDVWKQFDELVLGRAWKHEAGPALQIASACVDSGAHTEPVYRYVKAKQLAGRAVYAVKGASSPGAPLVNLRPSVNNRYRVRLFYVGTDTAKDAIYGRLKITQPGPLYCHFPVADWCDEAYFNQLTAERLLRQQVHGKWTRRYVLPPGKRNEALDCQVYALVAQRLSRVPVERLGIAASAIEAKGQEGRSPPPEAGTEKPTTLAKERLAEMQRRRTGAGKRRGWWDRYT